MPLIGGVDNIKSYLWPLCHVQRFLSPFERIDQEVGAIKVNPDRVTWSASSGISVAK
jgi:hypothetical protein